MPELPKTGTLTADGEMYFLPERQSYRASTVLARQIADGVYGQLKTGRPVVVADLSFLNDLGNLLAVRRQLQGLVQDYTDLTPPAGGERAFNAGAESARGVSPFNLFPGVSSLLPAALGALGMLKEDVEYKGIRTVLDPLSFRLAVVGRVAQNGHEAYVPDLISPQDSDAVNGIAALIQSVHQARASTWRALAPQIRQLAQKDVELDRASRSADQAEVDRVAAELAGLRADLDPITRPLEDADRRLADLEASLYGDSANKLTLLARLLRAEAIERMKPEILHVAIVSSGGYNRLSRSFFRMFLPGDGLSWLGGAVARWALLETDGRVRAAGVVDQVCRSSNWREWFSKDSCAAEADPA